MIPKLASEGPIARKRTLFASPGVMMIPPMETLSPVPTSNLVETLSDCAGGVGVGRVGDGVGVGVAAGSTSPTRLVGGSWLKRMAVPGENKS